MAKAALNPLFGRDLSGDAIAIEAMLALMSGGPAAVVYAPAINGSMAIVPVTPALVPQPIIRKRPADDDDDLGPEALRGTPSGGPRAALYMGVSPVLQSTGPNILHRASPSAPTPRHPAAATPPAVTAYQATDLDGLGG